MSVYRPAFTTALAILLIAQASLLHGQPYNDYQLRLEPVWSRVADVLGELGSIESVEFSPDGRHIVSGSKYDYSVIMWRTSDGAELWRAYTAQEIERVGWSADGAYVAACSEDFLVTVYDAATGEVTDKIELAVGIDGLTWSNSGSLLAVGEEESRDADGSIHGFIRVYDMEKSSEVVSIDFGATVNELFFSADDKLLLASGHFGVRIYSTDNWQLVKSLADDQEIKFITGVFSPDASHVFAGDNKGFLYLWEVESGKLLRRFVHTGKKIETVSWHPNGQYVAFAGHDPYIRVYRVDDIVQFKNDQIPVAHKVWASDHMEYIDFNADGSYIVSAHQNGLIKLWVWMGENPNLNEERHEYIKQVQKQYIGNNQNK